MSRTAYGVSINTQLQGVYCVFKSNCLHIKKVLFINLKPLFARKVVSYNVVWKLFIKEGKLVFEKLFLRMKVVCDTVNNTQNLAMVIMSLIYHIFTKYHLKGINLNIVEPILISLEAYS